jgi:hypothetical protein
MVAFRSDDDSDANVKSSLGLARKGLGFKPQNWRWDGVVSLYLLVQLVCVQHLSN